MLQGSFILMHLSLLPSSLQGILFHTEYLDHTVTPNHAHAIGHLMKRAITLVYEDNPAF